MMMLCVDPGQSSCGVALFDWSETWAKDAAWRGWALHSAAFVKAPLRLKNDPSGWAAMAALVAGQATLAPKAITHVVVERMKPRRTDGPARSLAMYGLSCVGAWIMASFPDAAHSAYFPDEWRGNVAGREAYCRRAREELERAGLGELERVKLPAKSEAHNVWAAVGLGLYQAGRFGLKRIYVNG